MSSYWGDHDNMWDWWHSLPENCFCKVNSRDAVQAIAKREYEAAQVQRRMERLEQEAVNQRRAMVQQANAPRDMTLDAYASEHGLVMEQFNEPWLMLSQTLVMTLCALKNAKVLDNYTLYADIPLKCIMVSKEYKRKRQEWFREGTLGGGYMRRTSHVYADPHSTQLKFKDGLLYLDDERAFSPWAMHDNHNTSMTCIITKPYNIPLCASEPGYADGAAVRETWPVI